MHKFCVRVCPPRMVKIQKKLTTSNSSKDMEQQELSFTVSRNANSTAPSEDSSIISKKTKHTQHIN